MPWRSWRITGCSARPSGGRALPLLRARFRPPAFAVQRHVITCGLKGPLRKRVDAGSPCCGRRSSWRCKRGPAARTAPARSSYLTPAAQAQRARRAVKIDVTSVSSTVPKRRASAVGGAPARTVASVRPADAVSRRHAAVPNRDEVVNARAEASRRAPSAHGARVRVYGASGEPIRFACSTIHDW